MNKLYQVQSTRKTRETDCRHVAKTQSARGDMHARTVWFLFGPRNMDLRKQKKKKTRLCAHTFFTLLYLALAYRTTTRKINDKTTCSSRQLLGYATGPDFHFLAGIRNPHTPRNRTSSLGPDRQPCLDIATCPNRADGRTQRT